MTALHRVLLWLVVLLLVGRAPAGAQNQLINGNRVLVGTLNFCADAGSTDAYACNLTPAITTYTPGTRYTFKANTINTGAATLALNGLAAKTIKKMPGGITTDVVTGDICAGQYVDVLYDGTNLQMTSQVCNASSGSGTVNNGVTGALAYYPSPGTTVDDSTGVTLDATSMLTRRDAVTAVSANTTLGVHNIVYCTAGASDKTMTLPAASSTTVGFYRVIKADSGAGACLVAPNGSDTLNGVNGTKAATTQWSQVEVTWTTTTNWHVVAGKTLFDLAADVTGFLPNANGGLGAALSSNGLLARTGTNTHSARTITAGSSTLTVSNGDGVAGNPTVDCAPASTTVPGCAEIATATEATTGTDTGRTVSPNSLAHSEYGKRYITLECVADNLSLTTGDGKCYWPVHADFNGWIVVGVSARLGAAVSSSGTVNIDIDVCGAVATGIRCSGTNRDLLTTNMTIDANKDRTETASVASVINTANDDLATGEWLRWNIDAAGTGAQGLYSTVTLQKP